MCIKYCTIVCFIVQKKLFRKNKNNNLLDIIKLINIFGIFKDFILVDILIYIYLDLKLQLYTFQKHDLLDTYMIHTYIQYEYRIVQYICFK